MPIYFGYWLRRSLLFIHHLVMVATMFHPIITADKLNQYIAKRMRQRRKSLKLSLYALSQKVDIPLITLSFYEKGRRKITASHLIKIAAALNVQLSFFLDRNLLKSIHLHKSESDIQRQSSISNVVPFPKKAKKAT